MQETADSIGTSAPQNGKRSHDEGFKFQSTTGRTSDEKGSKQNGFLTSSPPPCVISKKKKKKRNKSDNDNYNNNKENKKSKHNRQVAFKTGQSF